MRRREVADRVLATVLFTDIVGSTEMAADLGDRSWRELVARHHAAVRAQLKRHRGREIDTAGDGFFVVFERPAQAISCAIAIVAALRSLGIQVRAGIHIGEVELSRRHAGGIAVHTGARVMGAAEPGEILVTAMVRDLVAGAKIEFVDRGVVALKVVPGQWHLFGVVQPILTTEAGAVPGEQAQDRTSLATDGRLSRRWAGAGLAAVVAVGLAGVVFAARPWEGPPVPGPDTIGHIAAGGDAFDLAVNVGSRPSGVVISEDAAWVINFRDETLSRIDRSSGEVVANPSIGGAPTGVAFGGGAIWVTTGFGLATGGGGAVVRFNARLAEREGQPIEVGNGAAAITFGENALWVADAIGEEILEIDPSTNAIVRSIPLGLAPDAIAVGAGSVWVGSTLDRTVWRIDPVTGAVKARIRLTASPSAIAIGENAVWVASQTGDTLTRIDPVTDGAIETLPVGDAPRGLAVGPDSVWVALGLAGTVLRIDEASGALLQTFAVDGAPTGVVVDEEGGAWVTVEAP